MRPKDIGDSTEYINRENAPCPFCGRCRLRLVRFTDSHGGGVAKMRCMTCGATGSTSRHPSSLSKAMGMAHRAWNRRPLPFIDVLQN